MPKQEVTGVHCSTAGRFIEVAFSVVNYAYLIYWTIGVINCAQSGAWGNPIVNEAVANSVKRYIIVIWLLIILRTLRPARETITVNVE